MYKTFPKVSEIVVKDKTRPALQNAVVIGNTLIATDGHALIMLKTSSLVQSEEQEQNLSGKVFSRDLLLLLQKAKKLIFLKDKISVDDIMMDYSGTIDENRNIYLGNSLDADFVYPDTKPVIPTNPSEQDSFSFDPKNLARILDCFSSISVVLQFHGKTRPATVLNPLDDDQRGLIMPKGAI